MSFEQHLPFRSKSASIFILWYVFMVGWWFYLESASLVDTTANFLFGAVFGLIPLAGGLIGFYRSLHWGGIHSVLGRAVGAFAVGLCSWGLGTLIFAYYNLVLGVAVPYPSLADVFYFFSWPLWAYGLFELARATGARNSLQKARGKIMLLTLPLLICAMSYYLLVTVARDGVILTDPEQLLKVFFDLAYPIGDVVILTMAVVIFGLSSKQMVGGRFRLPVLILLVGFCLNYISDFSFSWTTTEGVFYVGSWVDFFFMSTMSVLSFGLASLNPYQSSSDV